MQVSLHSDDLEQQKNVRSRAVGAINGVEDAVTQSRFLHENYRYNPDLVLEEPHFSAAEEILARSGQFTED